MICISGLCSPKCVRDSFYFNKYLQIGTRNQDKMKWNSKEDGVNRECKNKLYKKKFISCFVQCVTLPNKCYAT